MRDLRVSSSYTRRKRQNGGKKEKVVDVREEKERNAAAIVSGTKMVFIGTKIVQNVSRIAGAK